MDTLVNSRRLYVNKIFTLCLLLAGSLFSITANVSGLNGQHFVKIWDGENGFGHMNVYIVSATLDGNPLQANDEIALFSGNICVGQITLSEPSNGSLINLIASLDDGTQNGFVNGDTMLFKIWDASEAKEHDVSEVIYRNDLESWRSDGRYMFNESSFVDLTIESSVTQKIELSGGWNIFSGYVMSSQPNMRLVMDSLIEAGSLIKVQDENGKTLENFNELGGWVNAIGNIQKTEGYKIKVERNSSFTLKGTTIDIPVTIPLYKGWNIISFPLNYPVNARDVFQNLINSGVLDKVKDQQGNSIEDWGIYGGWVNNIGNCEPGEGYEVNVTEDIVLTISSNYTKSQDIFNEPIPTDHFSNCFEGNGINHMNINILGLSASGFDAGDEIAIYDGDVCVGAVRVTQEHMQDNALVINATSASGSDPGFTAGNPATFKVWKKSENAEQWFAPQVLKGSNTFEQHASSFVKLNFSSALPNHASGDLRMKVYPNPSNGVFNLELTNNSNSNTSIEVYDLAGKIMDSRMVFGIREQFNLEHLPKGVYLIKANIMDTIVLERLIIK